LRIVALAGGVGGAKLVQGLAEVLSPDEIIIVVNTGDDFDFHGLRICPDLDTICYTLGGLSNQKTGWGRNEDSWQFLNEFKNLTGEDWFQIGDKDLATHVFRTEELNKGQLLHQVVRNMCKKWDIKHKIIPMSDDKVMTIVNTIEFGNLPFQEYFVKYHCEPIVTGIHFESEEGLSPAPGVLDAINQSDAVIICPSNPWLSIDPILNLPGIKSAIEMKFTLAVSPIIGGRALKGPAAKIFSELGITPTSTSVANHYKGLINSIFIDHEDGNLYDEIMKLEITPVITNTIMNSNKSKVQLANDVLNFLQRNSIYQ
jgi:LPPG:FO 2-phospho-L-lactate transferase